jgi:hypothetical protein
MGPGWRVIFQFTGTAFAVVSVRFRTFRVESVEMFSANTVSNRIETTF